MYRIGNMIDKNIYNFLKGKDKNVNLSIFKDSVLELFSNIIKEDNINPINRNKLARLRAQIDIELKNI